MRYRLSALVCTLITVMVHVDGASAQQAGRVYRVGIVWTGEPGVVQPPFETMKGTFGGLRDALRDRGYVVGKNLVVDLRDAKGDASGLQAVVQALIATNPDVLVTGGTAPTVEAMKATKTIPIVFPGVGTPVERGIVKDLINHGGNATGQAVNLGNPKIWQLLRDVAPSVRRVGMVGYAPNSFATDRSPEYRAARIARANTDSGRVGLEAVDSFVDELDELEPKVSALAKLGEAALFMSTDAVLYSWRTTIMGMAMRYRLPTVCAQWWGWAEAGCLITYGEDNAELGRRAALQVVKILNGTKPADIPIEQPTTFRLILNGKTARSLGLSFPQSTLAFADQIIE